MTQTEVASLTKKARDEGRKIVMIVPEAKAVKKFPSKKKVFNAVKISPYGILITEIKGCYVFAFSKITGDDSIDNAVKEVFQKADITDARGIIFF